jgi:site-specific DNA-methyltransferase (adenine-specific)
MFAEIRKQKIINSDCLKALKSLQDESVDVIITSPPYNINMETYYKDNKNYQDYLNWLESIFTELKRILKNNGSFFLNISGSCRQPYVPFDVCCSARKSFVLQNNIVWVKSISLPEGDSWKSSGHFKPIRGKRFLNKQHESIFHFSKNGSTEIDRLSIGVPYEEKYNLKRWEHDSYCGSPQLDVRCRGNVWYIPYTTTKNKKKNSVAFPVKLPEYCIKLHGYDENTVVLDPFLGCGTTLAACDLLNVNGIGIEIDEEYCKLSIDYLNNGN